MNKVTLLAGIAIGAVLTASVAQLQAQAPPAANTTRPAVFFISEQTFVDENKYNTEFAPKVLETIKKHGGRFIVRANEVTPFAGSDHPKRVVITGWESMDALKGWQNSAEYKALIPIRDASIKTKSFGVATCENPQGAKPGQTKCP
jgi:uncharacterized protein (DUF1330 family)